MQKPDRSSFTVLDFSSWEEAGVLSLAPKFQRRSVWKKPARSYMIDSILKGMPVPPIYLRVTQNPEKTKTMREVIDGQQRLRTVLDFISDDFSLLASVSEEAPGKKFSQLTDNQQDSIRKYSFICESFSSISDEEVLEVFARMNTYSVKLNAQELRNGQFFGHFKRCAYSLAHEHLEFWRTNKIFTDGSIARMLEVELVSELLVAQIAGPQDKKTSLDGFYADYDDSFPGEQKSKNRFRSTIDAVSDTFHDDLADSEFRRPPLFYSLFSVVYHRMFGLPKTSLSAPQTNKLSRNDQDRLKEAALELSDRITTARDKQHITPQYAKFIDACLRHTDNINPRVMRFITLYKRAFA